MSSTPMQRLVRPFGHMLRALVVPSTRVVPFRGKSLTAGTDAFVASSASVLGDVAMGARASVWYGATVDASRGRVTIGPSSCIQDNASVVAGPSGGGEEVMIGRDVTIGPGAHVAGTSVGDGAYIGAGAVVGAGARVGAASFVDAGAVLEPGAVVEPGQLWTGAPARYLRNLGAAEVAFVQGLAAATAEAASAHARSHAMDAFEIEDAAALAEMRDHMRLPEGTPLPAVDADVAQYLKLTELPEDAGLFRAAKYSEEYDATVLAEANRRVDEANEKRAAATVRIA